MDMLINIFFNLWYIHFCGSLSIIFLFKYSPSLPILTYIFFLSDLCGSKTVWILLYHKNKYKAENNDKSATLEYMRRMRPWKMLSLKME